MIERLLLLLVLMLLSLVTMLDGARNPVVMLVFSGLFTGLLAIRLLLPGRLFPGDSVRRKLALVVFLPMASWILLTWMQASISGAVSVDPYRSHRAACLGLGYAAAWLLFMSLLTTHQRLRMVAGVIMLVAFAQALFGMLNYYGETSTMGWIPTHYAQHRVTGTYVNRNFFANLLVISSGFALSWILVRPGRNEPAYRAIGGGPFRLQPSVLTDFAALVLLVVLLGGLVLSGSRGGLLSALAATVLVLCLSVVSRGTRLAWQPLVIVLAGVPLIFGFGLMRFRISQLGPNSADRLEQWRSTLELVALRPWSGYGGGAYETAFRNRLSGDLGPLTYNQAHNDYLQILLEQGVAGLLLAAATLSAPILLGVRRSRRSRSVRRQRWILSSLFGISAMLVHAMVDSPFQVPANVWVFTALLAILASATALDFRREPMSA